MAIEMRRKSGQTQIIQVNTLKGDELWSVNFCAFVGLRAAFSLTLARGCRAQAKAVLDEALHERYAVGHLVDDHH